MSWGLGFNHWLSGTKINNYLEDATSTWDSTTVVTFTVPTGKRWYLRGGTIYRTVASTCTCFLHDSSDAPLLQLGNYAAGTGRAGYPNSDGTTATEGYKAVPIVMDAGEYIKLTFGVAQDASASVSCVVMEVPYGP